MGHALQVDRPPASEKVERSVYLSRKVGCREIGMNGATIMIGNPPAPLSATWMVLLAYVVLSDHLID